MIKGTRNFLGTTGFVRFGVSTIAGFCLTATRSAKIFFCRENRFSRENRKKFPLHHVPVRSKNLGKNSRKDAETQKFLKDF